MEDTLCVINLTVKGKLYNPSTIPIVYQYSTESDINHIGLFKSFISDDNFINLIDSIIENKDNYLYLTLSYFYWNDGKFISKEFLFRNEYPLSQLKSEKIKKQISLFFIESILLDFYKEIYNKEYSYDIEDSLSTINSNIISEIRKKYDTSKISDLTLKLRIKKNLKFKFKELSDDDIETIIKYYV